MTDTIEPASYKISWEECDRITIHTLKYQRELVKDSDSEHPDDIDYNKKLIKAIDRVLEYFS